MRGRRRIDGEEGHLVLAGVSGSTLFFLWLVDVFRPFTGVTVLLFVDPQVRQQGGAWTGARCQVPGARCQEPGARCSCQVPGVRCQV